MRRSHLKLGDFDSCCQYSRSSLLHTYLHGWSDIVTKWLCFEPKDAPYCAERRGRVEMIQIPKKVKVGTDSTCSSDVDRDWAVHYYTPVVGCRLALLLTLQPDDSEADVTTGLLRLFFTYLCIHFFFFFLFQCWLIHIFLFICSAVCAYLDVDATCVWYEHSGRTTRYIAPLKYLINKWSAQKCTLSASNDNRADNMNWFNSTACRHADVTRGDAHLLKVVYHLSIHTQKKKRGSLVSYCWVHTNFFFLHF